MPHVIFDVGCETFGRVRVQVRGGGPALIAVTTGESLGEVQRYARRVTDIVALRDWEAFVTAPTGFRYVKVMALSSGGEAVTLEPVEVQHIRYDAEIAGSFACSDPTLDAIWDLSATTLHLCMQNEVWDGVKRDQLPWMGDLYTEALATYHVLGDASGGSGDAGRLVRHTLAVLAEVGPAPARPLEQARYPGLAAIWRGSDGGDSHDINGIPSYTMWWLVGLADYMRYTGDTGLIWELASDIRATLDHIVRSVGEDGLWRLRDGWDFVDWSPMTENERRVFCHLLAAQALGLGAGLLDAIGRNGDPYRRVQARMREAARRTWWADPATATFGASHHVNAMAIRSGILAPDEAAALFKRALATDPPQTMTYWHRYADLDAAGRVDQVQWGLDYIRRHWGAALRGGHSTLWEAFDPAWLGSPDPHAVSMVGAEHARYGGYETSLCHGWSAGPAVWLHTEVLGVRPGSPGFAAVAFNPALGSGARGLQWARGTVPTPRGPIRVNLDRRGAEPVAEIDVPAGVEVRLPERPRETWRVKIREQ
jgi:alpha-L-rhamnosidase